MVLPAQASPWPYYSFEITRCTNSSCKGVFYNNQETAWRNIPENLRSSVQTKQLTIWGVHCTYGTRPGNFSSCDFSEPERLHTAPLVNPSRCQTTAADNWVIADTAACTAVYTFNGLHTGSLPGAECGVLGKSTVPVTTTSIDTPFGVLTAEMVANSRDMYCGKPLTPPAKCEITIPNDGLLDHGIQSPSSQSERTLEVMIQCGSNPVLTIADPMLKMDWNRIQSNLSLTPPRSPGGNYLLRSVLKTTNATAGEHSAATVIVVTPN